MGKGWERSATHRRKHGKSRVGVRAQESVSRANDGAGKLLVWKVNVMAMVKRLSTQVVKLI